MSCLVSRLAAVCAMALAAVALDASFADALAADAPLTLAQAQRRAIERSRLVDAQTSSADVAREMAVAARQLPDPVLSLGINNLPVSGPDAFSLTRDFMTMRSVGVMQEWTRAEKRAARSTRFEREADRVLAERSLVIANIARDTALAWLDRHYAAAQADVVAEQARQALLEVEAAESAYRAGRGALADMLAARAALVGFDDRASDLRRRATAATIALARYVGDDASAPLGPRPAIDSLPFDRRELDDDLAHHPQIIALEKREQVAAAQVKVAQANRTPDWTFQVMYSQRGPGFSDMVSLGVSVPLQWDRAHRQDREIAAQLALLEQARAEREDAARAHRAEVRAMLVDWDTNRERNARYERELLPLAAERTQATLAAYRGGRIGLADVLVARRNEIDVRLQALSLEADAARSWAQLAFLAPQSATNTGQDASP